MNINYTYTIQHIDPVSRMATVLFSCEDYDVSRYQSLVVLPEKTLTDYRNGDITEEQFCKFVYLEVEKSSISAIDYWVNEFKRGDITIPPSLINKRSEIKTREYVEKEPTVLQIVNRNEPEVV